MPVDSGTASDQPSVRVAGLVLAAGAGRRYGMPKALVSYGGSLLVERAYRLVASVCEPVVVVLGAAADEVLAKAELGDADVVRNPDWDTGMGSSLRVGLGALDRSYPDADAVLVHLVDLPGMTATALSRLVSHADRDVLAVATYDGVRGHPVLLGRSHWAGVAESATGDRGARDYLNTRPVTAVECGDVADPQDLDYPAS